MSNDAPEEMEFIDFNCPYCSTPLSFLKDSAGLAQECLHCLEVVIAPRDGAQVGGKLPFPMKTPRLTLRRFHPEDWKDLLEIMGDEELMRYRDVEPATEESVVRWLEEEPKSKLTQPNHILQLGVVVQETGKLVGIVSLGYHDPSHVQADIGVDFNRNFHGKGYATEAVRAILAFGFVGIGLHRITVSFDSRNEAGRRLFERAGLRLEGELRQDRKVRGAWVDTVSYAMLASEFKAEG